MTLCSNRLTAYGVLVQYVSRLPPANRFKESGIKQDRRGQSRGDNSPGQSDLSPTNQKH